MSCSPPATRKRAGDRLGGREPPRRDADDLAARRVDRRQHDVVALLEARQHRGRSSRSEVLSASSVTIASSSAASPSAARRPELIAVPSPRLRRWRTTARCRSSRWASICVERAVGRAVVDDDHARAELAGARREVGQQPRDVLGLVVGGDYEADHLRLLGRIRRRPGPARVGMPSSFTGRELAAESRTASAAISARQPSSAADRLRRVVEDAVGERLELGAQRLDLAQREAQRRALGVAAHARQLVPAGHGPSEVSMNQTSCVM